MTDRPEDRDRAAALRHAFDRSFAEPPPPAATACEDLLAIRVAGEPYALRLRDITGLLTTRKVVPVPAATPHLLGLAGVRGDLVPVFDLGALLGRGALAEPPRWLALCGVDDRIALAFAEFEGHLRVPQDALRPQDPRDAGPRHVEGVVRTDLGARPVVAVPQVLTTIRNRRARAGPIEE